MVRGHCAKIVCAGMLREAARTVIQDCFEPLPVAIRECRTRLRADADAKKIERSVEVGFAVDGKRLPLRETLKMASPFPIVLCVPLESLVHILVARSGQHWSLVESISYDGALRGGVARGHSEIIEKSSLRAWPHSLIDRRLETVTK